MAKASSDHIDTRRNEIIDACLHLYQTLGFNEITIKKIAELTSFSRPSVYNYFQTKEEVFLAILQNEYELWIEDLVSMADAHETLSKAGFADELARSLEDRPLLLKLLSMNHYDVESNVSDEHLVEFKRVYGRSLQTVENCLVKYFPEMSPSDRRDFTYSFFPFMFGIYAYTVVNDKQRQAMEKAEVPFEFRSIHEIIYRCVLRLLGD